MSQPMSHQPSGGGGVFPYVQPLPTMMSTAAAGLPSPLPNSGGGDAVGEVSPGPSTAEILWHLQMLHQQVQAIQVQMNQLCLLLQHHQPQQFGASSSSTPHLTPGGFGTPGTSSATAFSGATTTSTTTTTGGGGTTQSPHTGAHPRHHAAVPHTAVGGSDSSTGGMGVNVSTDSQPRFPTPRLPTPAGTPGRSSRTTTTSIHDTSATSLRPSTPERPVVGGHKLPDSPPRRSPSKGGQQDETGSSDGGRQPTSMFQSHTHVPAYDRTRYDSTASNTPSSSRQEGGTGSRGPSSGRSSPGKGTAQPNMGWKHIDGTRSASAGQQPPLLQQPFRHHNASMDSVGSTSSSAAAVLHPLPAAVKLPQRDTARSRTPDGTHLPQSTSQQEGAPSSFPGVPPFNLAFASRRLNQPGSTAGEWNEASTQQQLFGGNGTPSRSSGGSGAGGNTPSSSARYSPMSTSDVHNETVTSTGTGSAADASMDGMMPRATGRVRTTTPGTAGAAGGRTTASSRLYPYGEEVTTTSTSLSTSDPSSRAAGGQSSSLSPPTASTSRSKPSPRARTAAAAGGGSGRNSRSASGRGGAGGGDASDGYVSYESMQYLESIGLL